MIKDNEPEEEVNDLNNYQNMLRGDQSLLDNSTTGILTKYNTKKKMSTITSNDSDEERQGKKKKSVDDKTYLENMIEFQKLNTFKNDVKDTFADIVNVNN